ncbi:hypothetical protein MUK42_37153, partial [Musa troglodytarum]
GEEQEGEDERQREDEGEGRLCELRVEKGEECGGDGKPRGLEQRPQAARDGLEDCRGVRDGCLGKEEGG